MGANADYGQGEGVLTAGAEMTLTAKADLDRIGNGLETNLGPTRSTWVGQGGTSFTNLYTAWVAKQKEISRVLETFAANLREIEGINTEADTRNASDVASFTGKLDAV